MSEMIERVAKAICEDSGCVWDFSDTPGRREWFTNALAALRCIRIPTDKMLTVLHDQVRIQVDPVKRECSILNDRELWAAVIDAALSEAA